MSDEEIRKLAAIMFTDMVGYSALSQRDDKLALELLEEHRRLLRGIFPRFHGTEIKTIGDAFLVEFNSALEAAQCSIEIQRALAKRNADAPADRQIELKIGIHIGDVVHRGGDVYGDGVNIASRIESLAGPGGICVSMDVERQIRNAVETRFEKLEPTELKNISVPMELFRIVLPWERQAKAEGPSRTGIYKERSESDVSRRSLPSSRVAWIAATVLLTIGIGWWWTTRPNKNVASLGPQGSQPQNIPEKSIAVLPFDNLSEDKSNAFFAEGVQDEILTRLAKVADLKVIARTSTQKFKSAPENLPDIAKQLGVMNILEGSVQKANDQVRVNVQLINALTNAHVWAEIYDRKLTDIFAVESDIAKTIADTLQAKLSGSEKTAMSKTPTQNPEAYQLYLQGRFFWNKRTAPDLRKAIEFFDQAITKDPGYAFAYAALAQSWLLLPAFNGGAPNDCCPQAEAAAAKALALDNKCSDAMAARAMIKAIYNFDFSGATAGFEETLQLNRNDATAHHWFADVVLTNIGQSQRALAEMKRALELDPLSLVINTNFGVVLRCAGRLDDAIAQLRRTVEMDSNFYYAHYNLGTALEVKGNTPQALAEYEKAAELSDDPVPIGYVGHLYGVMGRKDEARKVLERLQQMRAQHYICAYSLACVFLGLGDRDKAMKWLEQGYQERDAYNLGPIRVDPVLNSLHGDPRFEALAEKIAPAREFGNAVSQK